MGNGKGGEVDEGEGPEGEEYGTGRPASGGFTGCRPSVGHFFTYLRPPPLMFKKPFNPNITIKVYIACTCTFIILLYYREANLRAIPGK